MMQTQKFEVEPEIIELSNGIPVVLQPYEGEVAATYWWVRTGSADERKEEAGFAHFLEHMLFKDASAKETGKASTGKMARAIESLGGDINAYTSFDQTVYHVTCAAHHWERVLDAFGQIAKPQRFLKSDFESEREVILEELRKNEDSPGRQLFQSLFSATYEKHPYGRPVIGYVKTLNAAKVGDLEAFYKRRYVASRMGVILVGPIGDNRKKLIALLEKRFGQKAIPRDKVDKTPKGSNEKTTRPVEPPIRTKPSFVQRNFDVQTPSVSFAFRVPDLLHADIPAIDLGASILGGGELGRIYQRLFYKETLVTDASGGLYIPSDPGMLFFSVEAETQEKLEKSIDVLFDELKAVAQNPPTEEEMKRVLVQSESERLYSTQTADSMAGRIGFLKYVLGDMKYDRDYLERLRAVTPQQIQETLLKYFDFGRMSGVFLLPKGAKVDLDLWSKKAKAAFETKPESKSVVLKSGQAKGRPEPKFITRPSGLKVVYRPQPASSVVAVHASALGGLRLEFAEAKENWGASHLLSLTWTKGVQASSKTGSRSMTSQQIAAEIEGRAASLDGFAGRNTVGMSLSGLARDWNELSQVFSQTLINPSFPEEEIEHSKRVALDSLKGLEDHSSQLCSKLFLETLYESHPYGRLTLGSEETLSGLKRSQLESLHREWIRADRLVVSISGNLDEASLEKWISSLESKLEAEGRLKSAQGAIPQILAEPKLKAPRFVERSLSREQVHILVGSIGTDMYADDRYALALLETILGGQSGRLFIELREKKSLAYTVAPVHFEGIEPGYVGTYIASAPAKRAEAIAGIGVVHEKLASKGPTDAEMKRAQEYFLGRRAMDLQSDFAVASSLGLEHLYGLPYMDTAAIIKKVKSVTPAQVKEACRKYLVEPSMVTAVVG